MNTRVNKILGSRYPILVGTMAGWSNAAFVASAVNAGAFACIASSMFQTKEKLQDEIQKTKGLTHHPFGVNINLFPTTRPQNLEEYIDTVLGEGIEVIETAGRSPADLVKQIKDGGAKLMHKCARIKDAVKAESLGVDLVEIVGFECGGHPSNESIGGLVLIPQVVDAVSIPVIAGGGIGDARGLIAAFALGAEGVLLGTRFLASTECQLHSSLKSKLVEVHTGDSILALSSIGNPMRVLRTRLCMDVCAMEEKGATLEEILPLFSGEKSRQAMLSGDIDNSILACGQVVGLINEISPIQEIMNRLVNESHKINEEIREVFNH